MKKKFCIKSIYAKFIILFLSIWWLLNASLIVVINRIMLSSKLLAYFKIELHAMSYEQLQEFHKLRTLLGITIIIIGLIGTVLILLAIRGIVKPIKRLSRVSKEVAKGNFDIEVKVDSQDEIGQLSADFNLMTRELKNIDVLRKDFVSNVSHEFRTPITSIMGYARLIRSSSLTKEQLEEYSDIIISESDRLTVLSSNLLKLSELDSKAILKQAALFSLDEQIRKAVLLLEIQWIKKDLEFDIDLEELMLLGDKNLLAQVWLNLIQNAIKFSEEHGCIRISLKQQGNLAVFQINNQGKLIAKEDQSRIFERFYKGDKSRSREGYGLGLVLVKKIVELSGGKVYFQSEEGKGTTFIVELPIYC